MYFYELLRSNNIYFEENISTASISSIKAGGIANAVVYPKSEDELVKTVVLLEEAGILYKVIGGCTNTYFSDSGFSGALISTKRIREITVQENGACRLTAGISLAGAIRYLADRNISLGAELFGIPGSIGGAVRNNAGAFGKTLSDVMLYGTFFDIPNRETVILDNTELKFSYRYSLLQEKKIIFLGGVFATERMSSSKIFEDIEHFIALRRSKQPSYPSLGSFFKRNGDIIPAKLIDAAGLRGFCIGGASVSRKHAGFIVNKDHRATSSDISHLAEYIEETVKNRYGIDLQREAEFVG